MILNRRIFLKATLALPLINIGQESIKPLAPLESEYLLPLATSIFERNLVYKAPIYDKETDFLHLLNKHKGNKYIITETDKDWEKALCVVRNRLENNCRQILIAAGKSNDTIYGTLPEIHKKFHVKLGPDCTIFNAWSGITTIGIRKIEGNLVMPVFHELTVYHFPHKTPFAYLEIGLMVLNNQHICIGMEIQ